MPTYRYLCRNCGNEIEELQSFAEEPLVECPRCKMKSLARVIGTGGGLIFKGSGFYLTDYKNPPGPSAAKTGDDSGEKKPDAGAKPPAESKPAAGSSPPPEKKSE